MTSPRPLLITSLWELELQHMSLREKKPSVHSTIPLPNIWADAVLDKDLIGGGSHGRWRSGLQSRDLWAQAAETVLLWPSWHQQWVNDFGGQCQLSGQVINPRRKTNSSLCVVSGCVAHLCLWAYMANTGSRCCNARKWRLSSSTFPAELNIWLDEIIALQILSAGWILTLGLGSSWKSSKLFWNQYHKNSQEK